MRLNIPKYWVKKDEFSKQLGHYTYFFTDLKNTKLLTIEINSNNGCFYSTILLTDFNTAFHSVKEFRNKTLKDIIGLINEYIN